MRKYCTIQQYVVMVKHDQRTAHAPIQDLNFIRGHILPTIRFYLNDMLLYCTFIILIIHDFCWHDL